MKAKSIFVRGIFLFLGFYFLLPMSFNSVALSQENIKKLSKLQKEYDSLRLRYTQRHPDVAKLKRMIEKLKRTIEKNQKEHEKAAPKQETAPVKEIVQVEEIVPVKKKNNIKKKQHLRKKKAPLKKDAEPVEIDVEPLENILIIKSTLPLNPMLKHQEPGTWVKLPNKGEINPKSIHAHCGIVIDPATSILYFFGSDTHNIHWNNDLWSYNPVTMEWKHHYGQDSKTTYQYMDGYRSTTTGRPWCMHTFAMNVWDPVHKRLIVPARPVHYKLEKLPHIKYPQRKNRPPEDAWWEYDPAQNKWNAVKNGPYLDLGECAYIPTIRKVIGFNNNCVPVAFYDPKKKEFERLKGWRGKSPKGYTRRSVYDSNGDRVLLISTDKRLWSFNYRNKKWSEIKVTNWPDGGIYGSWDYDNSVDMIVAVWSKSAKGGFSNPSGKSTIALCDLKKKEWVVHSSDPIAPYYGMNFQVVYDPRHEVTLYCVGNAIWSFKAPSLENLFQSAGGKL